MDIFSIATELRDAIHAGLDGRVTVNPTEREVNSYPQIIINAPERIEYAITLGGMSRLTLTLTIKAQSTEVDTAWKVIYDLLSYNVDGVANSLIDALLSIESEHFNGMSIGNADGFDEDEGTVSADLTLTLLSRNTLNNEE